MLQLHSLAASRSVMLAILTVMWVASCAAATDVRTYRYEATVVSTESDSGTPFESVRQGDKVEGVLRYDLDAPSELEDDSALYAFPAGFVAATMYVDILGSDDDLAFLPGTSAEFSGAMIFDDPPDGLSDGMLLFQDVISPQGDLGGDPVVLTEFAAPPDMFDAPEFPESLNLDEWIYMLVIFESDSGYFEAEIYDLAPLLSGDYDQNGIVTAEDYSAWKTQFGKGESMLSGDGNFDGYVTIADYTIWRNNLDTLSQGNVRLVPEPATVLLFLLAVSSFAVVRRVI